MARNKVAIGFATVLILSVLIVLLNFIRSSPSKVSIESFEACVQAGYPIMESYPRQCSTWDGQIFVEVVQQICQSDAECEEGFYCKQEVCAEFTPEVSCRIDADCRLINSDHRFSCCWAGACEAIDYSLDKWIAVNKMWFEQGQRENCPVGRECGPAPMCPTRIINENFTAECIDERCEKVPLQRSNEARKE